MGSDGHPDVLPCPHPTLTATILTRTLYSLSSDRNLHIELVLCAQSFQTNNIGKRARIVSKAYFVSHRA